MRETTTNLSGTIAFVTFGLKDYKELADILLTAGCQIEVFQGENIDFEKIALLNSRLLLFDFDSTQPNQLDVFQKLKRIPRLNEIPVLFVSDAHDDEHLVDFALQHGVADLICLPFQKSEVLFRIKKLLMRPVTQSQEIININEARLESLLAINEYPTDSVQELLDFTLNEIIILTGSKIGYIYFYDEQKKEFTLNTWSKEVMDECRVVEPQAICQLEKTGIWGEVVRQRKPIIVNEFQAPNPLKKGVPEGHVTLKRFLSIPVFDSNQIAAVVGVGNKEEEYDQSDIRQLSLMMNSVWAVVRKKASEKKLVESEKKFRGFFEHSPVGISITSIDETIQFNQALCNMLGYTAEELKNKSWEEVTHPDEIEKTREMFKRMVSGEVSEVRFEKRYLHKSGSVVWGDLASVIHRDSEGNPLYFITSINDITDKKLAVIALAESNNKLQMSLKINHASVFVNNFETGKNESTAELYEFLGYAPDEIPEILDDIFKLVHPNDIPVVRKAIDDHFAAKTDEYFAEFRFRTKSGDWRWVDGRGKVIGRNAKGEPTVLLGISHDIHEKKLNEEALRESEERFRTTLYSIGDGVITTDARGNIQLMNNIAEKLTGWSQSEAKGKTSEEVFPIVNEDTHKLVEVPVRKVLRDGVAVGLVNHTVLIAKDGTKRPIADSAAPIRNENGEIIGVVLVFRDQTREREAERILQESEFFFRESQKAARIGSYKYEVSTGEWSSSEVLDEIFGIDQDFIRNTENWGHSIYPDDFTMMDHHLRVEVIGQKKPFNKEYRIVRKSDGAVRWVHGMGQLILDKSGNPVSMIGTIQDITERKNAESALQESEERYNAFINADTDMIFVKDDQCRYVLANEAMASFFNTTKEQILGKTDQELAEDTRVYPCKSSDQRILDEAEIFTIEERLGNRIYEVTKFPLELRDNRRGIGGIMRDVTERKRDEDAIQNERGLLRTLIDHLPDPIYVKDSEGRKLLANKADLENTGAESEADVIGKTDFELFDSKTAQHLWNDDQKVLNEGELIINREEIFHEGEKNQRWLLTTKVPLRNQLGEIVGLVGIGRDITQQRKASETILKLSKSIEQSPSSVVITDARGIIEYANPRFSEVTGYRPEEVIGQMLRMLKPGKISPEQLDELWKTINSGETWRGEINNRRKDKTKYLDSVVVTPVLDEHKRITNILIICEDITSQKREEKLKEVIQSITHDGSVAKDLIDFTSNVKKRLGDLIDLTNFYLALYDESKDMFWIPAYYDQCDDIETFDAGKTLTAYVLRSKKSLLANYNEICKLKDSGVIETLGVPAQVWMGVPLLVGEKAIGVLAVQSYDNPLLYNEQDKLLLERVAHEISYIIQRIKSDEEVKQALEKAEESDRLKSAFLANMSHEIRTPLNSIIGFSELLADSFFEEELRNEFIQHIITSGNQLLNIISDIVDISKIESGEIVIRKTELPAKKLLDEIRALHILKVESKLLHFRFAYPENITEITILADKERLHQVFNNLISNALKFTSEGYIEVGCRPRGEMVEFYVKDTGIGIDPKFHTKVFERFRQVETAFTRKFGGNGLGLAITKNLIELMGGEIWLESELGVGSTFFFTIPMSGNL